MIKLRPENAYEDACKLLGIRPIVNYKSYKLSDETRNFIKLETIAKALNEGWKPDIEGYHVYGCYYTDYRKPKGFLAIFPSNVLDFYTADLGIALELKDRETAKEFAFLCKPILVKHLLNREDYENIGLCF